MARYTKTAAAMDKNSWIFSKRRSLPWRKCLPRCQSLPSNPQQGHEVAFRVSRSRALGALPFDLAAYMRVRQVRYYCRHLSLGFARLFAELLSITAKLETRGGFVGLELYGTTAIGQHCD
jgi:hypothetical protein